MSKHCLYRYILFLVILGNFCLTTAYAGSLPTHILWGRQYDSVHNDLPNAMHADPQGNLIIVGESDTQNAGETSTPSFFITKIRPNGNLVWRIQVAKPGAEGEPLDVAVDADAQIYVAGSAYGSLFGKWSGNDDAFVGKWSSSGKLIWVRQFGTDALDEADSITLGNLGQVYVAGITGGTLYAKNAERNIDHFLTEYSRDGDLIAGSQQEGGIRPGALAADKTSHLYGAGDMGMVKGIPQEVSLTKYNSARQVEWVRYIPAIQATDADALTVVDNLVYLVGTTYHTNETTRDEGGGRLPLLSSYLACFSAEGQYKWKKTWQRNSSIEFRRIAANQQFIYAAGLEELVHQPAGQSTMPWRLNHKAVITCLARDGHERWLQSFGAKERSGIQGLVLWNSHLYVAGFTSGSLFGKWNGRTSLFLAEVKRSLHGMPVKDPIVSTGEGIDSTR